jgi:UDP-GlcNAc:undecaprenyl-phosphate GlcNAc-1-phosphate transferase
MPYLGGAAMYVAFLAIVLVAVRAMGSREVAAGAAIQQLIAILGGASVMAVLGLFDDRYDLPSLLRLGLQSLTAIVLISTGVTLHFHHFPWLDGPVSFVWIVGITNAFNLLDNMDGLSVGVGAIGACYFFLLAYLAQPTQILVASLAAALAGACLGFLRYNFKPARIFMGDAGAYFLGFLLAAIGMKLKVPNLHVVTWMIPIIVLGLPVFDTTMVTISRLRRGVSPGKGGKDHTSHRLVAAGMTDREAVMFLYLVCGALGTSSLVLTRATVTEGYALGIILLVIGAICFVHMEKLYYAHAATGAPKVDAADGQRPSERAAIQQAARDPRAGGAPSAQEMPRHGAQPREDSAGL